VDLPAIAKAHERQPLADEAQRRHRGLDGVPQAQQLLPRRRGSVLAFRERNEASQLLFSRRFGAPEGVTDVPESSAGGEALWTLLLIADPAVSARTFSSPTKRYSLVLEERVAC
jgi:hypothetical protein